MKALLMVLFMALIMGCKPKEDKVLLWKLAYWQGRNASNMLWVSKEHRTGDIDGYNRLIAKLQAADSTTFFTCTPEQIIDSINR